MLKFRSYFERELKRGILECVARFSIGLTGKVWLQYGEIYFIGDALDMPADIYAARLYATPFGESHA